MKKRCNPSVWDASVDVQFGQQVDRVGKEEFLSRGEWTRTRKSMTSLRARDAPTCSCVRSAGSSKTLFFHHHHHHHHRERRPMVNGKTMRRTRERERESSAGNVKSRDFLRPRLLLAIQSPFSLETFLEWPYRPIAIGTVGFSDVTVISFIKSLGLLTF